MKPDTITYFGDYLQGMIETAKSTRCREIRLFDMNGELMIKIPMDYNLDTITLDKIEKMFTITQVIMNHYTCQVLASAINGCKDTGHIMCVTLATGENE